jgi:hypothetical protein
MLGYVRLQIYVTTKLAGKKHLSKATDNRIKTEFELG